MKLTITDDIADDFEAIAEFFGSIQGLNVSLVSLSFDMMWFRKIKDRNSFSATCQNSVVTPSTAGEIHTRVWCKDFVIRHWASSLQTLPVIKKLDTILPLTRASFLAETPLHWQAIISKTYSRIPENFSGGITINIQLFWNPPKNTSQQMTWRRTHWHLTLLATNPDLKRSDLTSKELASHLEKNLGPQKFHRPNKQQFWWP